MTTYKAIETSGSLNKQRIVDIFSTFSNNVINPGIKHTTFYKGLVILDVLFYNFIEIRVNYDHL